MKLVITPEAFEDLREIEQYIGNDNPKAAVKFVDRLTERFSEFVRFPEIGRKRDAIKSGYRSVTEGDYVIFYRVVSEDALSVMRVIHGKRDISQLDFPESETDADA